ncbi:hypothetical protein [Roseivivax isoporae]|uniref:Uncharacterized protein n=1 Tax=Roseivivax isoporae LMG 25204 TaxID=1449351 RepID=X7F3E0_9RHOB|nr:hypothetical protein [Roseivivax isoporae]ETX26601.1 hypothetical protein RISW2_21785 [Roseivivax isoporae LMG 25204]
MKIKMKCDAHHRISSSTSQHFRAGREYSVPKATGEALITRQVAEAVPGTKTVEKE